MTEIKDTLRVPLQNDKVIAKLIGEAPHRLRIGFRVQSAASAQIRIVADDGGASEPAHLRPVA